MKNMTKAVIVILAVLCIVCWSLAIIQSLKKANRGPEDKPNDVKTETESSVLLNTEVESSKITEFFDSESEPTDRNTDKESIADSDPPLFDDDGTIITFFRQTAGYIEPEERPKFDPHRGYYGRLMSKNEKSQVQSSNYLSVGQEVTSDNISFKITNAVFSEKEGNYVDSKGVAPYYNVYVVINCDIKNCDSTSEHELCSKYTFNLIEGYGYSFRASDVNEKEYYSYYQSISPNTQIIGATVSFIGSRSLLTHSENLLVELICDETPVAYWKIEPEFLN